MKEKEFSSAQKRLRKAVTELVSASKEVTEFALVIKPQEKKESASDMKKVSDVVGALIGKSCEDCKFATIGNDLDGDTHMKCILGLNEERMLDHDDSLAAQEREMRAWASRGKRCTVFSYGHPLRLAIGYRGKAASLKAVEKWREENGS